jgi:hypothetical protein
VRPFSSIKQHHNSITQHMTAPHGTQQHDSVTQHLPLVTMEQSAGSKETPDGGALQPMFS